MLDGLLYPIRLPERALEALVRVARDLDAIRATLDRGLAKLEETNASIGAELRPLRTDVGVVRESTASLPDGIARLENAVDGLGPKLDQLDRGVGTLHGDLSELSAYVQGLGKQLDTVVGATTPLDPRAKHLDQNSRRLVDEVTALHATITGLKGSVEEVTKDLPGASGAGPVARMRRAIAGEME